MPARNDDELIEQGIQEGLIKIEENRVHYPVQKKNYDFTDPEEPIRARTYCKLVFEQKYPRNRIDFEIAPPARVPPFPADIVIYEEDEKIHVYAVVETKSSSEESHIKEAIREGLGNANLLRARYLLIVCGEYEATYSLRESPALKVLEKYRIPTIPTRYGKEPKYRFVKGGEPFFEIKSTDTKSLNSKFQRCHDAIWEGGKRDPTIAFDEMSKLLFVKVYDERFTKIGEPYHFQVGSYETASVVGSRIRSVYKEAQKKEPEIFSAEIELTDGIIAKIVGILEDTCLRDTAVDVKGRAFEKFLGSYFRGPAGQYFTPRQIVEFMVDAIAPTEDDWVIDPACGSGGFLLHTIRLIRRKIRKNYTEDSAEAMRIEWDFAHKQVFGIEINERIARIAMMNMIIHEDAHSNIECKNALFDFKEFDSRKKILPNKYSVVLTNPPLGKSFRETNEKILEKFDLGKRKSQVLSVLFIERCLELLETGGLLGIVLDEGILSNPALQYVRDFICEEATIKAIVSLPKFSFRIVGAGAKTSVLILEKKTEDIKDYPIFVAHINHVGYDTVGRPDKNELPKVLKEYEKFKRNPEDYKGFTQEETQIIRSPQGYRTEIVESWATKLMRSELDGRLDARHYNPKFVKIFEALSKSPYELKALVELTQDERIFYPPRLRRRYTDEENGVPFLSIGNVQDQGIDLHRVKYLHKETKNLEKYRISQGWLLITRSGTVGETILVPKEVDRYLASEHFIRVVLKDKSYNPDYILTFLRSALGKSQIEREIYGAVVDEISIDSIKGMKILIPPKPAQDNLLQLMNEAKKKRNTRLLEAEELRLQGDRIMKEAEEEFVKLVVFPESRMA